MKKIYVLALAALFAAATVVSAQTPAPKPEKKEAKKEMKKDGSGKKCCDGKKKCPKGKDGKTCHKPKGKEMPPKK